MRNNPYVYIECIFSFVKSLESAGVPAEELFLDIKELSNLYKKYKRGEELLCPFPEAIYKTDLWDLVYGIGYSELYDISNAIQKQYVNHEFYFEIIPLNNNILSSPDYNPCFSYTFHEAVTACGGLLDGVRILSDDVKQAGSKFYFYKNNVPLIYFEKKRIAKPSINLSKQAENCFKNITYHNINDALKDLAKLNGFNALEQPFNYNPERKRYADPAVHQNLKNLSFYIRNRVFTLLGYRIKQHEAQEALASLFGVPSWHSLKSKLTEYDGNYDQGLFHVFKSTGFDPEVRIAAKNYPDALAVFSKENEGNYIAGKYNFDKNFLGFEAFNWVTDEFVSGMYKAEIAWSGGAQEIAFVNELNFCDNVLAIKDHLNISNDEQSRLEDIDERHGFCDTLVIQEHKFHIKSYYDDYFFVIEKNSNDNPTLFWIPIENAILKLKDDFIEFYSKSSEQLMHNHIVNLHGLKKQDFDLINETIEIWIEEKKTLLY